MIRRPPRSTLFPYTPLSRPLLLVVVASLAHARDERGRARHRPALARRDHLRRVERADGERAVGPGRDRKSTRLNSSHLVISYAVFCLKKKKKQDHMISHAVR